MHSNGPLPQVYFCWLCYISNYVPCQLIRKEKIYEQLSQSWLKPCDRARNVSNRLSQWLQFCMCLYKHKEEDNEGVPSQEKISTF